MAQNFDNLDWIDGQSSVPGIFPIVCYIQKSLISKWPSLSAEPASASDEVTYQGDFTLAAEAVWKTINCIDQTSQPTAEPQGEIRCKSFNNQFTVKSSLTEEKATALAKLANNTDMVFLFRERDSKKWRVVGSEMFTTITTVSLDVGSDPTGERGITVEVAATDIIPFPFYEGEITTADGDINPSA